MVDNNIIIVYKKKKKSKVRDTSVTALQGYRCANNYSV